MALFQENRTTNISSIRNIWWRHFIRGESKKSKKMFLFIESGLFIQHFRLYLVNPWSVYVCHQSFTLNSQDLIVNSSLQLLHISS